MLKISRESSVLSMSASHAQAARAASGDTVIFETFDCFTNNIRTEQDLFHLVGWDKINPATGPLYIEGAEAGDVLKVDILDIQVEEQGVMVTAPGLGPLGEHYGDRERTKILPVKDGEVIFNDKISFPVNTMVGVIGTAPATRDIPTGEPGTHGANMDCKRIIKGATVYLPVNVDGALLCIGDLHAIMGDGETNCSGVEINGQVTVKLTVLKDCKIPTPLVLQGGDAMTVASADTIHKAAAQSATIMTQFVMEVTGMEFEEAAMLITCAGDVRINQLVNPLMTARYEMPVWVFEQYGYKFI